MNVRHPKRLAAFTVLAISATALLAWGVFFFCHDRSRPAPKTYEDLTKLNENELAKLDMGLVNLLCSQGLTRAESLDIPYCMYKLEKWTAIIKTEMRKAEERFPRRPPNFKYSLAQYKMITFVLCLKNEFGCKYNMALVDSGAMADINSTRFFHNPEDVFIQGLLLHKKGSCASFPVLITTIGRRCGFPLFLVSSKGHLFCRWDDGKERFNIESACEGVGFNPDEHYRKFPLQMDDEEESEEAYMVNLNSMQVFGSFSETRAACLIEDKKPQLAIEPSKITCKAYPHSKVAHESLERLIKGDER